MKYNISPVRVFPDAANQQGSALIALIIIIPFLILITGLYMNLAVSSLKVAKNDQSFTYSQLAVDAGLDYGLQQINVDPSWTGTTGEVQLQNENGVRTTYQLSLSNPNPKRKTITSIGRAYFANSTTPKQIKTVKIDMRPVAAGNYSIVTGVGGLLMSNSAKIVGGDVLVNGEIEMSNTAQIGLSTNAVKVEVAHQNCPNPATAAYPRLCAAGEDGQPISLTNSAHIYGSVKANNQTNGAGMSNPGLVTGTVPAQALPTHDRPAQKAAAVNNMTATAASCNNNGDVRNWPANVKITGDVTISKTCKVTINGNVWITGKLDMINSGQILVANSLGTTRPSIMIDGQTAKMSNSASLTSNSSGTGVQLLTYWSRAACSPDCSNVTGTDLFNSRNDESISLDNTASAPESILYARWTRVALKNSGGIGALVGQTVQLSNTATVTFGSTIATGTAYWVLDGYRRDF